MAVALVIVDGGHGAVDGNLVKIRSAEPFELRVGVGKKPSLQQRVVGKIQSGNQVTQVESHLLGFGEVVVGVAIEGHFTDRHHGHQFLGNELGRVQQVEIEFVFVFFLHDLNA